MQSFNPSVSDAINLIATVSPTPRESRRLGKMKLHKFMRTITDRPTIGDTTAKIGSQLLSNSSTGEIIWGVQRALQCIGTSKKEQIETERKTLIKQTKSTINEKSRDIVKSCVPDE